MAKETATVRRRGGTVGPPPPRYLTENTSGWRFQLRLPPDFFGEPLRARFALAGHAPMVRVQIGARRRGEARRLAGQLAATIAPSFDMALRKAFFESTLTMS